jgi:hypothetical protein
MQLTVKRLYGLYTLLSLQAARLVLSLGPRGHVSGALKQLHWSPVHFRIQFKLCSSMHHMHFKYTPPYLTDLLEPTNSSSRPGLYVQPLAPTIECRGSDSGSTTVRSLSPVQLHGTTYLTTYTSYLTSTLLNAS